MARHFVAAWKKVGTFSIDSTPNGGPTKSGGNVAAYFCTPDLEVLNAVAGPVSTETLLHEARWAVDLSNKRATCNGEERQIVARREHQKWWLESGVTETEVARNSPPAYTESLQIHDLLARAGTP